MNHDLQAIFTGEVSLYNDTDGYHGTIRKCELIQAKYTSEAKTPLYVPLTVLSRCQAERTQGLYPDTTVISSQLLSVCFKN